MVLESAFVANMVPSGKRYAPGVRTALVGALLSSVAYPVSAAAQEAPPAAQDAATAQDASGGGQLQEIVVTAQRRFESAQDVPISITAFSGGDLEAGGVTSALELGHVDSSVKTNFNQGVAFPFLRGIGNIAAGVVGNESSVAMYLDDLYYTRLFSSILELNSVDRVEVLKGPQGTLFGRNASGGAIQIFTRDPGRELEAEATVGYANYDKWSGQAYFSTPITDTLAWNIAAGGSDQNDGWGRSVANGQDEYLGYNWTVRSKLLWEPSATTKVKLVGFYAYQRDDFGQEHDYLKGTVGGTTNLYGVPNPDPSLPEVPGYPNPPILFPSLADSGGFYDSYNVFRNDTVYETYGASLRIDQQLGFADFVSITGFKNSKGTSTNQINWHSPDWFAIHHTNDDNQITQEIQLKSPPESSINWILGAFYMHYYAGYTPSRLSGDFLNILFEPGAIQEIEGVQTIDSYSAFGQATVPLSESTNITAGLRYTDDQLKGRGDAYLILPSSGRSQLGPTSRSRDSFQRLTWKAAIDHHLSDDVMIYASYSRGYKAGTYNTIPLSAEPAKPEIVDAYELGFKSELFDRHIRLNGALFWNDIKDPQVLTIVGTPPAIGVGLINAEKARTRGFELGLTASIVEGLELRANVTYLDAEYVSFTNAPHYEGGIPGATYPVLVGPSTITDPAVFPINFDASGYTMPNSPKWSAGAGLNYAADTRIGRFVADTSLSYTSRYDWGVTYAYNGLSQKPVALLNASLNFTPASFDNVTFGIWGKNLGNVQYYAFSEGNDYGFGVGQWRGTAAAPRTYGGTISVRY